MIKSLVRFFFLFLFISTQLNCLAQPGNLSTLHKNMAREDYLENTVIIKVKEKFRTQCSNESIDIPILDLRLNQLQAFELKKKFPRHTAPVNKVDKLGRAYADLSLIYEIKYLAAIGIDDAIKTLLSSGVLEYAEPHYIPKLCYTPNDPLLGNQYYILDSTRMQMRDAWNLTQGDTNIVIGITDTGADINQEDLVESIKYNYQDPLNGIDDDLDGYTDNYRGWDLGDMDNNPQDAGVHGSHVSGIAAATVNNGKGIAGIGFKCKFLPVKVANSGGSLTMAYEGIVYAADHGCDVVNCSWGSTAGGGQYGQDIITYATINENCLVVAAAGNNNTSDKFYPAAYKYVLSVANVDNTDSKFVSSSYGCFVDISAPGTGIQSTFPNNSYNYSSGTSMAAPVISGAIALLKSYKLNLNALQLAQQLKATADDINSVNPQYADNLGNGRVNMFKALTVTNKPSFESYDHAFNDRNNNYIEGGDTVRFSSLFINYLAPSANAVATLSCSSPYVVFLDNNTILGNINTLDSVHNNNDPFEFRLLNSVPVNHELQLKITYTDGSQYLGFECFSILVNTDFINYHINDIASTATSNSLIGYDNFFHSNGQGFMYKEQNLLYECGLMVGTSISKVSDNVRTTNIADKDFARQLKINCIEPSFSDLDLYSEFNDDSAYANKLNIQVKNSTYMWTRNGHRKYVISKYIIQNKGSQTLSSLYGGLFADWDIMNASQNKASYDAARKMGYVYSTQSQGLYAGIQALSNINANCYSVDNIAGGGGGLDISSNYNTQLKYQTMSMTRNNAGNSSANGNDVCQILSYGPFTVSPGDSIEIAFALLAGDDISDLQQSADSAYVMYNTLSPQAIHALSSNPIKIFPNPVKDRLYINNEKSFHLIVYNNIGQVVLNNFDSQVINTEKWAPGFYYLTIECEGKITKDKIIKF